MEVHGGREKQHKTTSSFRHTSVRHGRGVNIGGLVVWGGSLAIASFIALFTVRARRSVAQSKAIKVEEEEEESELGEENRGLRVALQSQTTPPLTPLSNQPCCGGNDGSTHVHLDCCDSVSSQCLNSEEKVVDIKTDGQREPHPKAVISDDAKTESIASFGDLPPAMNDLPPIKETWGGVREGQHEMDIVDAATPVSEEEPPKEEDALIHYVEEEEEYNDIDAAGGGSEVSSDSSVESNNEVIWPLESIEEVNNTLDQDSVDVEKQPFIIGKGEKEAIINYASRNPNDSMPVGEDGLKELVAVNHHAMHLPKSHFWISSILLVLALLLLLIHDRHSELSTM